ncbi:transporter [Congregibacter sp.]|uniref:transporter n=1 Tax=Congregibacter sp. TaxID=2744308 RepID=UPI003F6B0E44
MRFLLLIVAASLSAHGFAQDDLAKAAQNPIASLISVPIQSNNDFDWGPDGEWFSVSNIQPVIPLELNDDWNLVTRTIVPIISQPGLTPSQGRKTGIGDTLLTAFLVPKNTGKWSWGVGPAIQLPTATDDRLGGGEWGAGASVVALTMPGRWVIGGLLSNVWGVDTDPGNEINLFTMQPFINYNLDEGWYLTSSPIITRNAEADS